jgi:hypothetical protein
VIRKNPMTEPSNKANPVRKNTIWVENQGKFQLTDGWVSHIEMNFLSPLINYVS